MIDDRQFCVCSHPASDHDHGVDCGRCDCYGFIDQNDLMDREMEGRIDQVREK